MSDDYVDIVDYPREDGEDPGPDHPAVAAVPGEVSEDEKVITIPIYDKFKRITLFTKDPDCAFGLHAISMLVPPLERGAADKTTEKNESRR